MTRVGVLTGGGDCPGLNAVIRGVVRTGVKRHGHELVGLPYGWAGAMNGDTMPLTLESTAGILPRGGTILGTSRTNPFKDEGGPEQVLATLERQGIDALIPIGGEDTLAWPAPAQRARRAGGGGAEDDRQRPGRHRLHLRLPDRRADRHRRDRPPAHHGRVAQPRDHRRGDGPPRGLDRRVTRAWPAAPTRS